MSARGRRSFVLLWTLLLLALQVHAFLHHHPLVLHVGDDTILDAPHESASPLFDCAFCRHAEQQAIADAGLGWDASALVLHAPATIPADAPIVDASGGAASSRAPPDPTALPV